MVIEERGEWHEREGRYWRYEVNINFGDDEVVTSGDCPNAAEAWRAIAMFLFEERVRRNKDR